MEEGSPGVRYPDADLYRESSALGCRSIEAAETDSARRDQSVDRWVMVQLED